MEETTAPDTDTSSVSARLLEAAHSVSNTPDPFASITLADIAARIDKPESSILYQIEPRGDVDALTIFRQLAYVRVVERFDTGIGRSTHEAVLAALASRVTMPQAFAAMCAAIALQFRTDPATPYLLGARARSESNPALATTIDSVWERLTSNLVDLIQLVLAANQQHLTIGHSQLGELARTAVVAGWTQTELVVHINHPVVEVDGASFEQTGLVLWTGIRGNLAETAPA